LAFLIGHLSSECRIESNKKKIWILLCTNAFYEAQEHTFSPSPILVVCSLQNKFISSRNLLALQL
jgi:hypothetical protein